MPVIAERALREGMRGKSFERVYCFFGDDEFLKESTLREFLTAAVDGPTRDFNVDALRGADASAEVVDTVLNTPPMLSARRVVVIRDAHALSREGREVLERYIRRPALDTIVLLVLPAGEKPDTLLLAGSSALEFRPLTDDRVPRWIVHYARTVLDVEVSAAAATLLHVGVGGELAVLAGELDKLASYTAGAPITQAAVAATVGLREGESLGDLLDAVAVRDASRAGALVPRVLAQPKTTLVTVVMTLTTQLLAIGWGRAMRQRSGRSGAHERDYFTLLRESRAFPGRSWSEAVACWSRAASHWSDADIDAALTLLLDADRAAKETRFSSDEQLLTTLVLTLCAPARRAAA